MTTADAASGAAMNVMGLPSVPERGTTNARVAALEQVHRVAWLDRLRGARERAPRGQLRTVGRVVAGGAHVVALPGPGSHVTGDEPPLPPDRCPRRCPRPHPSRLADRRRSDRRSRFGGGVVLATADAVMIPATSTVSHSRVGGASRDGSARCARAYVAGVKLPPRATLRFAGEETAFATSHLVKMTVRSGESDATALTACESDQGCGCEPALRIMYAVGSRLGDTRRFRRSCATCCGRSHRAAPWTSAAGRARSDLAGSARFEVVGIDITPKAIVEAKRRAKQQGRALSFTSPTLPSRRARPGVLLADRRHRLHALGAGRRPRRAGQSVHRACWPLGQTTSCSVRASEGLWPEGSRRDEIERRSGKTAHRATGSRSPRSRCRASCEMPRPRGTGFVAREPAPCGGQVSDEGSAG